MNRIWGRNPSSTSPSPSASPVEMPSLLRSTSESNKFSPSLIPTRIPTRSNTDSSLSASTSKTPSPVSMRRNGTLQGSIKEEETNEELDDDLSKLPFSPSQIYLSQPNTPLTPHHNVRETESITNGQTKDDLLLELLSGQALLDAHDWKILDWETAEALKKEQIKLIKRVNALEYKLALENRMKDVAQRLNQQSDSLHTREEEQRIELIRATLDTSKERLQEIGDRLAKHTAAILVAVVRRHDLLLQRNADLSQSRDHLAISQGQSQPRNGFMASPSPSPTTTSFSSLTKSSIRTLPLIMTNGGIAPFEGQHLFANNRNAVLPPPAGLFSPVLQSASSTLLTSTDSANLPLQAQAQVRIEELTSELKALKSQHAIHVDSLQEELESLKSSHADNLDALKHDHECILSSRLKELDDYHSKKFNSLQNQYDTANQTQVNEMVDLTQQLNHSKAEVTHHLQTIDSHRNEIFDYQALMQSHEEKIQSLQKDLDASKNQLSESQRKLSGQTVIDSEDFTVLNSLWRSLPSRDARSRINDNDDLNKFKQVFEPTPILGNFTADLAAQGKFSIEDLSEKIRTLIEDDKKLVNRLVNYEGERDSLKFTAERSQKMLQESKSGLQTYQKQLEAAATKEASLLGKLNELESTSETLRQDNRKLESSAASTNELKSALEKAESEVNELREQLADAQDDLDDIKSREQKQRINLLDELNTAQSELSNLRSQLRQEQRRRNKSAS